MGWAGPKNVDPWVTDLWPSPPMVFFEKTGPAQPMHKTAGPWAPMGDPSTLKKKMVPYGTKKGFVRLKKVSYTIRNLKKVPYIVRNLKKVPKFVTNSKPF